MPKGYLVANIRVTDAEKFQAFAGMAAIENWFLKLETEVHNDG